MKRNILASALMALALLAAVNVAAANEPPALGRWWRAPGVAQALGITAEESRRLDEMNLKMSQERIQKRSELQQARLMVDNLFDQEPLDQPAIQKQFERLAKAQSELAMVQSRFLLEVRKLLGRDRWQQLRQEFRKFRQRRQEQPRTPRY
jgi:hypothetical protein